MSHKGGWVITSANSSFRDLRDAAVTNMAPDDYFFCSLSFCVIWCMLLFFFLGVCFFTDSLLRHTPGFSYTLMHMHTLQKRGIILNTLKYID